MKQVEKLYGLKVATNEWHKMSYKDVLESKIRLAWARVEYLNRQPIETRDFNNINSCVKAVKFNEELLKEMK